MSIFEKSQLELRSNPNVFLNPMENINQRGITDWSEVTDGEYGYDRWMKIDANTKRQPVEDIGLLKEVVYTLSYVLDGSTVSKQITSPASGHWHNSDLDVPIAATLMKLELGSVATPFMPERPSDDLSRCRWYCTRLGDNPTVAFASGVYGTGNNRLTITFSVRKTPSYTLVGSWETGLPDDISSSATTLSFYSAAKYRLHAGSYFLLDAEIYSTDD